MTRRWGHAVWEAAAGQKSGQQQPRVQWGGSGEQGSHLTLLRDYTRVLSLNCAHIAHPQPCLLTLLSFTYGHHGVFPWDG